MFAKFAVLLFSRKFNLIVPQRNVQVTVVGGASEIGSNLALMLKLNPCINKLQLYDDNPQVKGMAIEIDHVAGGPDVSSFTGDANLAGSLTSSDLVIMVDRKTRKPGQLRKDMLPVNAPLVEKVCCAIAAQNPDVFFAISTNPINSIIPFASMLLYKYNCYNPCKIFGITHIDTARSRAFVGNALQANPRHLWVPVIGGHSDNTIIPLFSNLTPYCYAVDACLADALTRLVRKAGAEVINYKHGLNSATLAMAWAINEFATQIIHAINGGEAHVHCYTANENYGTRFFAGPTVIGPYGIIQTCSHTSMNDYENSLLESAIPSLNEDVINGEALVHRNRGV